MPSLKTLVTEEAILTRVKELGAAIRADAGDQPVVLLAVLKGAYPFLADLSRAIEGPVEVDFMQVKSWDGEMQSSGIVKIVKDHDVEIRDRYVVIVEDIIDTGLTLTYLREFLGSRQPASLKVAAMFSKPAARTHATPVEYIGFEIENQFVVGYGLDYAERYRNLPFVAVLTLDPSDSSESSQHALPFESGEALPSA
jgi:hypoxanthine phosphoribosyltransferase